MGSRDNWQTPNIAVDYLLPFIPKRFLIIWEPACGYYMIKDYLRENGYAVYATDIIDGDDFFEYELIFHYDAQITNPPYSKIDDWIKRSFELNKPFALLLPLYALHSKTRCNLWRGKDIQIIIPPHRINFIDPDNKDKKKTNSPFAAIWVTWKFGLKKDLNYL